MMQGLHHHHQLAALLTAALPKDAVGKTTAASSSNSASSEGDESSRLAAIASLHGAILYPPNSLLVAHSASFLVQGLLQLLSDKLYSVRHAAAKAYGALCSALCLILITSNGRQNHVMLGTLVDQFIGWSLPSLGNVDNENLKLALESLHEFFNVGEAGAVERYALPVLKACQELLEDERTSMNLLPDLLGLLTLISLKFFRCFQPHFMDIVDLLLGWAMVPDIMDSDKQVIMDSFLQFQKCWVNNMQFSLGLLSKFLGDMDVLLQDNNPGTPQQFKRLLALLSCFCTVLRSVASGLLEINFLEQLSQPLSQMVPDLCRCLSMIGRRFGWSKWVGDCWRCLTLLAEILSERFSAFYSNAVNLLFQSVDTKNANQVVESPKITSFQVHGVLKTNLQLLSLQKLGLLPSSVHKILRFDGPISQLRLHPNCLVTASAAATYIFLLQHPKNDIVVETMDCLFKELQILKFGLGKGSDERDGLEEMIAPGRYYKAELVTLIKFDLKVLLSCLALGGHDNFIGMEGTEMLYVSRAQKLIAFLMDNFDPIKFPCSSSLELQVTLLKTLERLTAIEFSCKCSLQRKKSMLSISKASSSKHVDAELAVDLYSSIVFDHLRRYSVLLGEALDVVAPLAVKLQALGWIKNFCQSVGNVCRNMNVPFYPCHAVACSKIMQDLLFSILAAASDSELEVRFSVATVIDMLLKVKIVQPVHFPVIAEVILEKLGDSEKEIKDVFLKLLSIVLPMTIYTCGLLNHEAVKTYRHSFPALADRSSFHWKQVFALKQLPQKLHSQHLVSILSYISQRWKVPLSKWIQRLIHSSGSKKHHPLTQPEEIEHFDANGLWWDIKVEEEILERISSSNHFAGAWWAIHEAARFCISTRLRTNLGGPTQTFAALERMLLDISHFLQLEAEQNDGNLTVTSSYAHLLPMRLLLEFVEALKKNVYNAFEGSTILPPASRTSSLFFRANKKVCEEWFSRISEPMMDAGLALQCHHATLHYCALRLKDLSNLVASVLTEKSRIVMNENLVSIRERYAGNIFRIIRNMALAFCRNHDPDALVGLQKWANMAFSPLLTEGNQGSSNVANCGHFSWITGLVYQAGGQHEKAAAYFMNLLHTEESLTFIGSDGVQFTIARIIESYTAISDWKSLESWLLELQTIRAKHAGKSFSGALTTAGNEMNSIQALSHFDEGDFQAAWSYLDLTPKSSNELTLNPRLALQRSEQMLLQAILLHKEGKFEKVPHELEKSKLMLEETFTVLPLDGLMEAAPHINQLHCISTFEEACKIGDNHDNLLDSLLSTYIETKQFPCHQVHQDCSLWLKVLRIYQNTIPTSPVTLELCKNLVTLARKQGNLMLAARLNNYLKDNSSLCSNEDRRDYFASCMEYENILLMRAENKREDSLKSLWSFVRPFIISSSKAACGSHYEVLKAKSCLKFSSWLQRDCLDTNLKTIVHDMIADFNKSEIPSPGKEVLTFSKGDSGNKEESLIEELVGTARKSSTLLCPTMGKSWILYASWCYSQARVSVFSNHEVVLHSCSFSPNLPSEIQSDRFKLTEEEQLRVKEIILPLIHERSDHKHLCEESPDDNIVVTESPPNELKSSLQNIVNIIETAAGAPGAEEYGGGSLSAAVSFQLQQCIMSSNMNLDEPKAISLVADLVDVWWSLRRRRVSLFGLAAGAFINYLSCSSSKSHGSQLTGSSVESNDKYTSYNLRAMLYVLHILVNFGVELNDILQPALSKVPLLPWQEITPQLFAGLGFHPEKVVRKLLEDLLIMLAKLYPCSLVYPTLVDANSPEKEPSEELQNILACLNQLYPRLVQDSQLMIKELQNITVLWEELWLGTLQDLHGDVMRRINLLKEEASRIAENKTLSHMEKNKINAAKYSAMMAPIVVVLERRLTSTSQKPETPHELWFLEEYQEQIKSAVTKFKTPPASVTALGDVWRPFEIIATSLASHQRKSSVSFGEVTPHLASLVSSNAPMPGLEKQIMIAESEGDSVNLQQDIVTIAAFSEHLAILPTKTKPKKLFIVGSDGMRYTYLLKGREDLRLDARIMQLLQAINGFLSSSSAPRSHSLGIRYYSVTPISRRAGLIQWVNNVTSIYTVFKSWQNRVQLQQLAASGADAKTAVPPVPRPSDMFYGKIIPALKEKGIRRVISRRDWPHDVKRKVLLDLMKETPAQLLHQELWCASEGFRAFSSKLDRFSGSMAAMSVVGHILGLGDRHLDNILIDFRTGDILHIDYNVCFEKGKRLKIPEIVPFRLTQTIEAALGLTGIEGSFRANCEDVLCNLKKNKDIILMLLEVFVWDPLVEWTRENFHDDAAVVGEERKGMELAVSLSLFASRVQEIRVPLQEHHDLLLSTLPAVDSALESFTGIMNQFEVVSRRFYDADHGRSDLALHETYAKSVVAEAASTLERSHALLEVSAREFAQAKTIVMEKALEAATWVEQHRRALDTLRSSFIPENKALVKLSASEEDFFLTCAVSGVGVPLSVVPEPTQIQCRDIDSEVSQLVSALDHGVSSASASLEMYSLALQHILPLNYLTTSPMHSWEQLLLSLNTLSSEIISAAVMRGAELVASAPFDRLSFAKSNYDALCLKMTNYVADIERLEKECSDLAISISPETESKAKERLLSASLVLLPETHQGGAISTSDGEIEEEKEIFLKKFEVALCNLFSDVKHRISKSLERFSGEGSANTRSLSDLESFCCEFEEQIEKCVLVTEFFSDLKHHLGLEKLDTHAHGDSSKNGSLENWASLFKATLLLCKNLVANVSEVVVPSVMNFIISYNSSVMDIFGSISQIRGSIDTALEKLTQVELERVSLTELESNYFVEIGLITEQQLALKEAAVKGRDHLSWEEAEELASQEEACRVQLDNLHSSWNQKDVQTSSLMKKEANIYATFDALELQLQSLISAEQAMEPPLSREKAILATIIEPFSKLESVDQALISSDFSVSGRSRRISYLVDLANSGFSLSEFIWQFPGSLRHHAFFIWTIFMVDLFLDTCTHNMAASFDQNLGLDQLVDLVRKKVKSQFQEHISKYLKDRVAPIILTRLDKEIEILRQRTGSNPEHTTGETPVDFDPVREVQLMLEDYCNAHETFRAGRSAAAGMKMQVNELKDALLKTALEVVQMEWMYNITPKPFQNIRLILHKYLGDYDNLLPIILDISRPKFLESIQSSVALIAKSLERLQACEAASITAEGQLERAMGWACGVPSSSSVGTVTARNSGIPSQFHEHLMKRQKLLQEAREHASDRMKVCISILEFETSRDGFLRPTGEMSLLRSGADGGTWQQAYLNAIKNLDVTYHSFTRAEAEWFRARSNMEAASNGLISATNDLSVASAKAKAASGDLQSTLLAMRDSTYEASAALSAYVHVVRSHSALTSECGFMLEEILAITEGLGIHSLGKEAAFLHSSLIKDLSEANAVLIPLESLLSKDAAAMTDAMARNDETNTKISPVHGQVIFQSYNNRVKEAIHVFKPLLQPILSSVKGVYSVLTKLARAASLHAGNLHKALEGLGESLQVSSQDIDPSGTEIADPSFDYNTQESERFSNSDGETDGDSVGLSEIALPATGLLSPPETIDSGSEDSDITSAETSVSNRASDLDVALAISQLSVSQEKGDSLHHSSSSVSAVLDTSPDIVDSKYVQESIDTQLIHKNDSIVLTQNKSDQEREESKAGSSLNNVETVNLLRGGKNAYAMSVLRRVEMKLDGRDISETREISIAEQVDFLLRQATNIDNLCNMYEGWTPWI